MLTHCAIYLEQYFRVCMENESNKINHMASVLHYGPKITAENDATAMEMV